MNVGHIVTGYIERDRTMKKLNVQKFMKTELGSEMEAMVKTWDNALDERRKVTPGLSSRTEQEKGLGYKYWNETVKSCGDQWNVYKLALMHIYGIEFCFTRTDEYFGVCSADESIWLMKEMKDTTMIGDKSYLVTADCLVDDCMMTWEIRANSDEEAFDKGYSIVQKCREADGGSCEVLPIRGGAWNDPMNSCFYTVKNKFNGFIICEEIGKEYPDSMFALKGEM